MPSLKSPLGLLTVLVFHLLQTHSANGQSQLIGPSQPILATVGDDIILPCHLEPAEDVTTGILEWTRSDLKPSYVHVARSGQDLGELKHPSYKDRTSLIIEELKHGNISLKLSKVKLSDKGTYKCYIYENRQSFVKLVFGAVSSPVVNMTRNSSVVVLQCESKGWYPQPEVFWLDGEGNLLSAEPTETVRGPDDLYTVSSRVTVEKRHNNNFTCKVQQAKINQIRETHIIVPDDFFPVPDLPDPTSSSSSFVPTIIGVIICIVFILAVVFVVWKWRQNKLKNTKNNETSNSTSNDPEKESQFTTEAEKEKETEMDKEREILLKQQQTKEREEKTFEKNILKYNRSMREHEFNINRLRAQLEEVEKKLQSVNSEKDEMDPERQKVAAVDEKRIKNDLERKKEELQKDLQKSEKALQRNKSDLNTATLKKMKKANEKKEINEILEEIENQRTNRNDSDEDL